MDTLSDIGVVIINWNTKQYLLESIASYLANGVPMEHIVLVDQGSTDGSVEALRWTYPAIRLCIISENRGYGHAANCGAMLVKTQYFVVSNADVIVPPGTLLRLKQEMMDHPSTALLGCHHKNAQGKNRTQFSRTTIIRGMMLEIIPQTWRGTFRHMERFSPRASELLKIRFVEGAFLFLRHAHFDSVGGFDEGFSFFFEDADLPMRLIGSGFDVQFIPSISIIHFGSASFSQYPVRKVEEFYSNFYRLYQRHALRRAVWMRRIYNPWFWIFFNIFKRISRIDDSPAGASRWPYFKRIKTIFQENHQIQYQKQTLEENPYVSIIIPTFQRPKCLLNLLQALRFQTFKKFEVLVVNQSQEMDSELQRVLDSFPYPVTVLHSEYPQRSNAKNIGIRCAKGDIILFCDDDIIPSDEMLEVHVKYLRDETIGGVSCRIIENNLPYIKSTDICRVTWYGRMKDGYQSDVSCNVGTLVGGNMSLRRDVLHEIGYFDVHYQGTSIYEEQDLSERLNYLGYRIYFTNETTLEHQPQKKGNIDLQRQEPSQYYHDFHHNEILFFLKNRNHWLLFVVIPFCVLRTFKKTIQFHLSLSEGYRIFSGTMDGMKRYYRSLKL